MAQAVRKYKVSFLTVRTWMKKVSTAQKPAAQPRARVTVKPKSGTTSLVKRIAACYKKITGLENEIASMKALVMQEKQALAALLKF